MYRNLTSILYHISINVLCHVIMFYSVLTWLHTISNQLFKTIDASLDREKKYIAISILKIILFIAIGYQGPRLMLQTGVFVNNLLKLVSSKRLA